MLWIAITHLFGIIYDTRFGLITYTKSISLNIIVAIENRTYVVSVLPSKHIEQMDELNAGQL